MEVNFRLTWIARLYHNGPLSNILGRVLSGEAQQVTSRSFGVGRIERFFNALALSGQFTPASLSP
jgi:hypothetical protein